MCMRTNIDLDDDLVAEAQRLTGIETKRGVVHEALRVLVELKRRRSLTELAGKIRFAEGYDHEKLRERG
ncbi:MAG: type II toxin-antitoxin system VapB family antitoxin [Acidobacteriota bacterium]